MIKLQMMIIPVYYYDPLHLTGLSNPVFLQSNLTPTLNSSYYIVERNSVDFD